MEKILFGTIARDKGYVDEEGVERALKFQRDIDERGEPHKLIGIVMLEMGMLNSEQLLDCLQTLEKQRKSRNF